MTERWTLTREQAELVTMGVMRDGVLLTTPGSPNDILWGELCDVGYMEPADAPKGMSFLHAWKFTEAGKAAILPQPLPRLVHRRSKMSNWQSRIIQNDHPKLMVGDLAPGFVAAITEGQISANKGWAPDATDLIDRRIVECPGCGASGMNTCWGYWAFECGAEILSDGEPSEPCGAKS